MTLAVRRATILTLILAWGLRTGPKPALRAESAQLLAFNRDIRSIPAEGNYAAVHGKAIARGRL